jgi:hypothetical protein
MKLPESDGGHSVSGGLTVTATDGKLIIACRRSRNFRS